MILTADRIFDGESLLAQTTVCVRDGVIAPPSEGDTQRHDYPGCTILPGLIDTHVHLVFSALATNADIIAQVIGEDDAALLARAERNARAALMAGITTVRDCGGRGTIVRQLRDRLTAPTILTCGAPITTATGHCHWLGAVADTGDEVVALGERMLVEGADFLKVMATGGNMTPSSDPMRAQYDDATLARLADLGRRAGKHAAAHVLSRAALPGVVAANYRTIEHCDWRVEEWRYEFDPALARRIVEQGQFVGLTMSGTARRALNQAIRERKDGPVLRLDARFECERRMLDAGPRYTIHSDAGVRETPIESFALGLRCAAIELGLTPREVLRAVTATAAEAIGLTDRGRVAIGKRADLLIVEGDPLRDLAALSSIRAVICGGELVENHNR